MLATLVERCLDKVKLFESQAPRIQRFWALSSVTIASNYCRSQTPRHLCPKESIPKAVSRRRSSELSQHKSLELKSRRQAVVTSAAVLAHLCDLLGTGAVTGGLFPTACLMPNPFIWQKCYLRGWRDGSGAMSTCCWGRPGFASQHPQQPAPPVPGHPAPSSGP